MGRTKRKAIASTWEKAARRAQRRESAAHRMLRQQPVPDIGTRWAR